jgi:nicotinamidase-related amidase
MTQTLPQNATLVVIDVQRGFDAPSWPPRSTPAAEANVARLLEAWRRSGRPVIHVQHDSQEPASVFRPGQPGNAIKSEAAPQPGEAVVHKNVNSAFIGTDLEERLKAAGCAVVVLVGLTTNHCVSTTARMAGNLGFTTYVASDATAAFETRSAAGRLIPADVMHEVGLAELDGEFASVVDSETLIRMATGR